MVSLTAHSQYSVKPQVFSTTCVVRSSRTQFSPAWWASSRSAVAQKVSQLIHNSRWLAEWWKSLRTAAASVRPDANKVALSVSTADLKKLLALSSVLAEYSSIILNPPYLIPPPTSQLKTFPNWSNLPSLPNAYPQSRSQATQQHKEEGRLCTYIAQ